MEFGAVPLWILAFLVAIATAAFVPNHGATVDVSEPTTPACPMGCKCSSDQMEIQCLQDYTQYSFDSLLPWQLQKLKILGDGDTLKQPQKYSSIKAVLKGYSGNVQLRAEKFRTVFSTLHHLEMNYFPLAQLSVNELADFSSLRVLSIGYNNISKIVPISFENQVDIERLNLNGNKIQSLFDNVFHGMSKLTHLYLESNGLDFISSLAFSGLDSLKVLSLKNNNIQSVDNFIGGLSLVRMLDLEGNKISYILNASLNVLKRIEEVIVAANPFQCSCVAKPLVEALTIKNSSIRSRDVHCADPPSLEGVELSTLKDFDLSCDAPAVTSISEPIDILYHSAVTLSCSANGTAPLGIYWVTPWGDTFASVIVQRRFPELLVGAKAESVLQGINNPMKSRVLVSPDSFLHIDNFRGFFKGTFTCIVIGFVGVTNGTVAVDMHTKFPEIYIESIFIAVYFSCGLLAFAILIGSVRWFVYKCCHGDGCHCCCCRSDDLEIEDKSDKSEPIEVTYEPSETCATADDSYDTDYPPPCPPVNSPQRLSPDKCGTPIEEIDPSKLPPHIWEQLDEVRLRLRDGAERKMEKVRSHVRSITDTGSLKIRNMKDAGNMKIQSIKESGSNAAFIVKKNVASGMVQVKYGVQSIKEFCGTGEMGTGTISMVSVSTDVDSKEQVRIVKSHTFV